MSARDQLRLYLEAIEKRLRLGALLRGLAILGASALIATVVLVLIANALAFSHSSVLGARSVLFIVLVCALAFGAAIPLLHINRRRAAGAAEAAFPQFQERLVTLAADDSPERQPFLELLAADTLKISHGAEASNLVPNAALLASAGVGLAGLGILLWMILAGPGYLGYGASLLWTGNTGVSPLYDIRVTPGDANVRRNADLLVTAAPHGIQADHVQIFARYDSSSKWTQLPMQPQASGSGFQFLFAGLPEGVEYYVAAGELRSRHFKIRVADLPSIKQIRVTYRFPGWTAMPNRIDEQGGDLRALEGTQADLQISTDHPLGDGVLVLEDGSQIHLTGSGNNLYAGTVPISKDGAYHIATIDQGQETRLTEDYFIEADKADAPEVSIARPGGDYRASPIEEVTVAAKVNDAFGLNDFALHYSVNGGPEQSVNLLQQKGEKTGDGSTTLHLEDFKVVPGDVIAVYASAKDAHAESRTDIAFIQTDPFEREFSQSQQSPGGGGGGGGGGNAADEISQREKEIIAATWKQSGDTSGNAQKAAENSKFLSGVQSKLRDQALSLAGRVQMRALAGQNQEFSDFDKDMNAAAEAMGPASQTLGQQKWKDSLPQEQKALQYLLRAEATFRQIQVAFGNAGGGGGGGAGSAGRDLASLFDLELDTQKNQYETGQTAESADQRSKDIDEALQKLDELARRQQELASQPPAQQTSEQRWQQEMLRREAEELQRQIEQLSRNGQQGSGASSDSSQSQSAQGGGGSQGSQSSSDARIQQALNQMRQANDDMRRATGQQPGSADARRAAERLKDATNMLGGAQRDQSSSQLDSLTREADRLANEQRSQADRIQKMGGNPYGAGGNSYLNGDDQPKLADDRQQLGDDLSRLEKQMRDAVRNLSPTDRDSASKLRDALRALDQADLDSRIQRSADLLRRGIDPNYGGGEPQIAQGLQQLDQQLRDAQQALGSGGQRPNSEDALNQVQNLRDRLESLDHNFNGGNNSLNRNGGQPGGQQGGQQVQPGGQTGANGVNSPRGGGGANIGTFVDGGARGGYRDGGVYGGMNAGNDRPLSQPVAPDTTPVPPERAYRDSMDDLDKLLQSVQDDPETLRQVQELIKQMQDLDPSRFPGNPQLVERLHNMVLANLDKLELELRRGQDGEQSGDVRSSDSLPVPSGYQDAVAEYFRQISKTKNP